MQDVNSQLFSESVEHELTLTQKNISEVSLDSILEQLNIREFKNVHPMSLSGGQKQRVAIATSIVDGAALMYFDEPTSGMDYKNMLAISHCIQSLKSQKRIIFIVSHDVEFLNITCDYILNIERFSTRQLQWNYIGLIKELRERYKQNKADKIYTDVLEGEITKGAKQKDMLTMLCAAER